MMEPIGPAGRAEANLNTLLSPMEPMLSDAEFVFCSVPNLQLAHPEIDAICSCREREGLTLILRRAEAERHNLAFTFPCRMITLSVHSSLAAVGFLARIASELAARGIAVNAVSAYYHDHLFVPAEEAERAVQVLRQLQAKSRAR